MNEENCALKLVNEIILYYDARSKKTSNYVMQNQSALNQCTVQTFTESEDTRCCVNTIFPPEDRHVNARNMSRIIV